MSVYETLLCVQNIFSKPLYDIHKTFEENLTQEYANFAPYKNSSKTSWRSLFGYPLISPIGVPACAIMTSKGIALASKLGFNVLTYKTIRSYHQTCHDYPNMIYVDCDHQITAGEIGNSFYASDEKNKDFLAISNSFGINSGEPDWLKKDIGHARASLSDGQILIVSVLGCPSETKSIEQDFAETAQFAYEAGAHIIEVNLSCPNIHGGLLYKDPELVFSIVNKVSHTVPIPIIIKIGIFDSFAQMRNTLLAAAHAGARGICGINSIPIKLVNKDNTPFFGAKRNMSGLSGDPIRSIALQFILDACRIIKEEKLGMIILATGGITKHEHFQDFFDAGAAIAMSATGMMWKPSLALEYYADQEKNVKLRHQLDKNTIKEVVL